MKIHTKLRFTRKSGIALLYAVFAAMLAASFIAVTMATATVTHRDAQVQRFEVETQYLAEGAIETAKKQIQNAIANWGAVPTNGTVVIDGKTATFTITPTGFATTATDPSGIRTLVSGFEIDARASSQGIDTTLHRVVNAMATPLFQYAVFYHSDLEILPGPNMTIRGRVHSNRDLYLGCGNTLTLDTNYVHSVGNIYRNRKDDPTQSTGTVNIRNFVSNPFDAAEPVQFAMLRSLSQMAALGIATTSGYDSRFTAGYDGNGNGSYTDSGDWLPFAPGALAYWAEPSGYSGGAGTTVMTQDHGVSEAVPPGTSSTAMFEATASGTGGDYDFSAALGIYVPVAAGTGAYSQGYYHDNAQLSVITYADNAWKAFDSTGVDVSSAVTGAISIQQMYDARQANGSSTRLYVTQIDVEALKTTGKFPANGLLYAAHYGEGTGLNAKGIRLKNGHDLGGRLTVATPDPMYIWGDFNTVAEKPAAVICDALNLLSRGWDDTKTAGTLPNALDTTYNVAVVTGNVDTAGNAYSGGFENLPRFHENWNGRTATIKGSFVKAWFSQYATNAWVYGNDRYTAPARNWSYNTNFNDVANLPSFTPMAVTAEDVVTW